MAPGRWLVALWTTWVPFRPSILSFVVVDDGPPAHSPGTPSPRGRTLPRLRIPRAPGNLRNPALGNARWSGTNHCLAFFSVLYLSMSNAIFHATASLARRAPPYQRQFAAWVGTLGVPGLTACVIAQAPGRRIFLAQPVRWRSPVVRRWS